MSRSTRDPDDPKVQLVAKAIRGFDWYDYGLDDVADADPQYSVALAQAIVGRLDRENLTIAFGRDTV